MKTSTLVKLLAIIAAVITICIQSHKVSTLKYENTRLENNQAILISKNSVISAECELYRVSDSLNARRVSELRLTLDEYEKYRSEDLALIKKLKIDKADMQKVIDAQATTIYNLSAQTKDTIIVADTAIIHAKSFDYNSYWADVNGVIDLNNDLVTLSIHSREELSVIESVERERFLGFLWKTKRIKRKNIDVVSKNPNTEIIDIGYVSIETK